MLKTLPTLLLALCLGLNLQAQPTSHSRYIASDDINLKGLFPLPPAAGSAEQAGDMATVLWLQRVRTPAQIIQARANSELGLELYRDIISASMAGWNEDSIERNFEEIGKLIYPIIMEAKDQYGRARPYAANLQVQPCVPLEESTSYPSGHAFAGLCYALLLADMFPELREALIERGMQIGYDRVVGGVHYPSDVLAGQRLAMACAEVIIESQKWAYWKQSAQRR